MSFASPRLLGTTEATLKGSCNQLLKKVAVCPERRCRCGDVDTLRDSRVVARFQAYSKCRAQRVCEARVSCRMRAAASLGMRRRNAPRTIAPREGNVESS